MNNLSGVCGPLVAVAVEKKGDRYGRKKNTRVDDVGSDGSRRKRLRVELATAGPAAHGRER